MVLKDFSTMEATLMARGHLDGMVGERRGIDEVRLGTGVVEELGL